MDPRDALDITIKTFKLKAADIAKDSGITVQMLSRYRKKRQDMTSVNAFQVIKVLPRQAQNYFWHTLLLEIESSDLDEKLDEIKLTSEVYNTYAVPPIPKNPSTQEDVLSDVPTPQKPLNIAMVAALLASAVQDEAAKDPSRSKQSFSASYHRALIENLVLNYLTSNMRPILAKELSNFIRNKDDLLELIAGINKKIEDEESI